MQAKFSYINNANPAFIEDMYQKFKENPDQVDVSWQKFFEGVEFASHNGNADEVSGSTKEIAVFKLIDAYRSRGHLIANTNPIRERRKHKADLELGYFGLSDSDLKEEFDAGNEIGLGKASLQTILDHLQKTYCRSMGVEYMYCRNEKLREWIEQAIEPSANDPKYSTEKKKHILEKIQEAVHFENFLHTKYVGKKRFSLEGLEALIPSLDSAINQGAELGAKEFVLGMAHRGRLNVLVNVFQKTYDQVFSEFEEFLPKTESKNKGDVKYHLGRSADIKTSTGHDVHLSLVANPSHLEAVNPVVQGIVYAKGKAVYNNDYKQIVPILIHGDAAIAGQGVNYELVNMSALEGYSTEGTVHIVLNNQVGFTANYKESRSSIYCTDIAKVTESPVFHVNADDPEAVTHAVELAVKIRNNFGIDVYVDILGYRRYGHNEGDEPRFTQPLLYDAIKGHKNAYDVYLNRLVELGTITQAEANEREKAFKNTLQKKLEETREKQQASEQERFSRFWKGYRAHEDKDFEQSIQTGVSKTKLDKVFKVLSSPPKDFHIFNKSKKLLDARKSLYQDNKVDWAMSELLAYASLLVEGHGVRLSGQDSQRGTFSHRHSVLKDVETEETWVPLNELQKKQSDFQAYNSHLSEYCVMGFEYGYSLASPSTLVVWEAQFGDFSNGAQIMIDQFVASAETKWQRSSGLAIFLPHGYEGQGPEHSSARVERYLQLCADNNMYVVNATTPANFFHLLRRQVSNEFRIPLVVLTPKSLLRHPEVISTVDDLTKGQFQEIIDDVDVNPAAAKRVLVCNGKVYYDLLAYRRENKIKDVAIVRLEQLYPLPESQLNALQKRYAKAKEWFWVQEEPANMGAWSHILRLLPQFKFNCVARDDSASPAVGNSKLHAKEQSALLDAAFKR